ncbi:MAG: hypothetical protein MUC50_18435 [Myxococcota bacterium]|nr:hypothetical protein [Myxococcota bacterium]
MKTQEIRALISEMFQGEYGPLHEFESKHDPWRKSEFLDTMLSDWDRADPEGRALIIGALRSHIEFYWCCFTPVTDLIVRHATNEAVVSEVLLQLERGIFCVDLLDSMLKASVFQEKWVEAARQRAKDKMYKETSADIDLDKMHRRIASRCKKLAKLGKLCETAVPVSLE